MKIIKEIRQVTGLTQEKMADWLGVSKNHLQFAEKGERGLPSKATIKLSAMIGLMEQLKSAAAISRTQTKVPVSAEKLAERHKQKMEFHQRSAVGLRIQLRKLQAKQPKIDSRLLLIDLMKKMDTSWYSVTAVDHKVMETIEWLSNERKHKTGDEAQELLQDKIDTHLAYAELHRNRMQMYKGK